MSGTKHKSEPNAVVGQHLLLQESFRRNLPERLASINAAWRAWDGLPGGPTSEAMMLLVHGLVGASGSFGYTRLSAAAHNIECELRSWFEAGHAVSLEARAAMQARLQSLSELTQSPDRVETTTPVHVLPETDRLIYLIEDDAEQAENLTLHLSHFGYSVRLVTSETVATAVDQLRPAALVVDIMLAGDHSAGIETVSALQARTRDLPVVFISSRTDFDARLGAARAGGSAYLEKPFEVLTLVDKLDRLTATLPDEPLRVVIVDDDIALAELHGAILQQAGMEVSVVSRPREAFSVLASQRPDLVLLDIYMPECSGIELAKLIRQHDPWIGLPIVFLSSESDQSRQVEAMRTGAEDFLVKPVDYALLTAVVGIRARRGRELNAVADHDGLTGLLKLSRVKERLADELKRTQRTGTSISLVLIDIDHFKQINDRHGHSTGDRVLRGLARMLRARLRPGDIAGRYGGEEFVLILPNCQADDAVRIVDSLRRRFCETQFVGSEGAFSVSFSAGVISTGSSPELDVLWEAADSALYEAKHQGRNRVRLSSGV